MAPQEDRIEDMEEEEEEEALTLWLKAKTATAHKEAETSAFIKKLMKGQLVRPAYARFIAMLFLVYSALESRLQCFLDGANEEERGWLLFLDMTILARKATLRADLMHLLHGDEIAVDLLVRRLAQHSAVSSYVDRVAVMPAHRLLAHAYVRYLGDLSGGQFIGNRVAKLFGAEAISFYQFTGQVDEIKDAFREGMNAISFTRAQRLDILEEAQYAFTATARIFEACDLSKCPLGHGPNTPAPQCPLRNPLQSLMHGFAPSLPWLALAPALIISIMLTPAIYSPVL